MIDNLSAIIVENLKNYLKVKENKYRFAIVLDVLFILIVILFGFGKPNFNFISPFPTHTLMTKRQNNQVFGFAPYWTFQNLDAVDFSVLSTFAYFGITVNPDGTFVTDDPGYLTFDSKDASRIFQKAHNSGTSVVLTLTQMDNNDILALMDNPSGQSTAISKAVDLVKSKGLDGVNIDFEYMGDPGDDYRNKFTAFIKNLSDSFHREIPGSSVTVSVYASAIKDPKIYNIKELSKVSDSLFMMAYDFAVSGSENAIPTSPLYGYKQGKYWYDISTAVDDFLKVMPSNKLILGLPWYGYNYSVTQPQVDAQTYPYYGGDAQMYGQISDISAKSPNISSYETGWDNLGKVGYKAYYDNYSGTWRMVFIEDPKSLSIKYDFAKSKQLAGVGIWALGFENGKKEVWDVLREKFGTNLADSRQVIQKAYVNTN